MVGAGSWLITFLLEQKEETWCRSSLQSLKAFLQHGSITFPNSATSTVLPGDQCMNLWVSYSNHHTRKCSLELKSWALLTDVHIDWLTHLTSSLPPLSPTHPRGSTAVLLASLASCKQISSLLSFPSPVPSHLLLVRKGIDKDSYSTYHICQ